MKKKVVSAFAICAMFIGLSGYGQEQVPLVALQLSNRVKNDQDVSQALNTFLAREGSYVFVSNDEIYTDKPAPQGIYFLEDTPLRKVVETLTTAQKKDIKFLNFPYEGGGFVLAESDLKQLPALSHIIIRSAAITDVAMGRSLLESFLKGLPAGVEVLFNPQPQGAH